jgi:hypothetical protein
MFSVDPLQIVAVFALVIVGDGLTVTVAEIHEEAGVQDVPPFLTK